MSIRQAGGSPLLGSFSEKRARLWTLPKDSDRHGHRPRHIAAPLMQRSIDGWISPSVAQPATSLMHSESDQPQVHNERIGCTTPEPSNRSVIDTLSSNRTTDRCPAPEFSERSVRFPGTVPPPKNGRGCGQRSRGRPRLRSQHFDEAASSLSAEVLDLMPRANTTEHVDHLVGVAVILIGLAHHGRLRVLDCIRHAAQMAHHNWWGLWLSRQRIQKALRTHRCFRGRAIPVSKGYESFVLPRTSAAQMGRRQRSVKKKRGPRWNLTEQVARQQSH